MEKRMEKMAHYQTNIHLSVFLFIYLTLQNGAGDGNSLKMSFSKFVGFTVKWKLKCHVILKRIY